MEIEVFVAFRAPSMLLEEFEIEFDETLTVARALSTLDEEVERLSEDV